MAKNVIFKENNIIASIISHPEFFTRSYCIDCDEKTSIPDNFVDNTTAIFEELTREFSKQTNLYTQNIELYLRNINKKTNSMKMNISLILSKEDFDSYTCQIRVYGQNLLRELDYTEFKTKLTVKTIPQKLKELDESFKSLINKYFK